jgi:glycerol-3-phosphate dehydrogenase (NAD(P)+)
VTSEPEPQAEAGGSAPDPPAPAEDGLPRVAVIGTGAWGTTLALLVAQVEPVVLLARSPETAGRIDHDRRNGTRLPGIDLPPRIRVSADPWALLSATELVIVAVPSAHVREVIQRVGPSIPKSADVLSVVKGLERGTLQRMSEVIAAAGDIGPWRIGALSGPNLAHEIARGLPASAVVASLVPELGDRVVARLSRRAFRLYTNPDVVGVELCGALKNIIAIAAGAADGLGFGDNGKAGLITRGLAEMTRLGIAAGANPLTFAGLAGVGDVIATCGSNLSRNHRLGDELASGRKWAEIETRLPGVAEGAFTVDAALGLAAQLSVEMPIAQEVHNALFEGKSVQRCLIDLLARESKDELADFQRWVDRLIPPATPSTPPTASPPAPTTSAG